jgi:hypothetical protein
MSNNNHYYYDSSREPIKCVGLGCNNNATSLLKIRYLNKSGHFCQACKNELIKSDLIVQQDNTGNKKCFQRTSEQNTRKL